jgi:two-component system phosphate regulon sensor histidine kinase PhoR
LKSIWWRSGATLLALIAISALVAALFSIKAAATFFAIWIGLAWIRDQRYLAALVRWTDSDGAEPLPPASGPWDDLFAKLYRSKRDHVREHDALADALASLRRAAQALPEGVVMLNAQNQILWCNDQAEDHFELRRDSDAGQSIWPAANGTRHCFCACAHAITAKSASCRRSWLNTAMRKNSCSRAT